MPELSDFEIIVGDAPISVADPKIPSDRSLKWEKKFDTINVVPGSYGYLTFMVSGFNRVARDVDVKINGTVVGKIENYKGATAYHWFTQLISIQKGVLRDHNVIEIEGALLAPGTGSSGDRYDDFQIKNLICNFKQNA